MKKIRSFFRGLFTLQTREELQALFNLAWPVSLLCIFENMLQFITLIFCGHLERNVFSGVCLAVSYISVTAVAIGNGLGTAVDTLISQTFGAGNKRRVGIIVQTSLLIFGMFCLPIWGLWLNAEHITSFIVKDRYAAKITGQYMDVYMPALPAIFLFTILSKYMENQEIVKPLVVSGAFTSGMSIMYNLVLIYGFDLGFKGAAIAGTLGNYTLALSTLVQIWWKKLHCDTWEGWTKECLLNWGLFYELAIPGLFMFCIEWWAFQAGTVVMGVLGDTVLNAQGIIFQIEKMLYSVPFGLSVAVCARVGILLGSGRPEKAKFVTHLVFHVTWVSEIVVAVIFLSFTKVIGYAFTSDLNVITLLEKTLFLYFGVIIYLDWVQIVFQGVFRGCGYQKMGAIVNNIAFILIALPLGISLALMTSLSLIGYWLGILAGVMFQFVSYSFIVYWIDWKKESEVARECAGVTIHLVSIPHLKQEQYSDTEPVDAQESIDKNILLGEAQVSSTYGGTSETDWNRGQSRNTESRRKSDHGSIDIPLKTLLSRVAILLFSVCLFTAGLVCRFML